jgi:hypothetical protein
MKHDRNHHPVHRPQEIAALIGRYRASGLALKDFAREQGLPPGRLHYWLYQKHRPTAPANSGVASGALFQEIKLAGGAAPVPSWAAEVSLPRGVAVRFNAAAQPGWIGAVVQALQRPC